jgi:predicted HicB family RNase H-like nuclease
MPKIGSSPVAYDTTLHVLVPAPLRTAIVMAADAHMQSVNSFVRGAVLERLRREGFSPGPKEAA